MRVRTSSRPSVTDWPMMLEWNCSRLVITVASTAVPIAPPRLRNMLLMPEAAAASCVRSERDRLADDVGVELLALSDHGGEHRSADRAAEIAEHVADARSRRGVLRPI